MAHTPGPWHDEFDRVCKAQDEICSVSFRSGRSDENHANARLIAAAPELLAALQDLYTHCVMVHKHWGDGSNQKEADAAIKAGLASIAKATKAEG